ncbi:MAG: glycosyltransferase family 4 protein [Chloroflexi bacterium]|nr:glycosyltransferase family 4 protein [Chloroflexota bacterium]
MRIGINTLAYVPGRSGGDGTYVRNLVAALASQESEHEFVVLCSPWNADSLSPAAGKLRKTTCPLPSRSFTGRVMYEQLVLPTVVKRQGLDILHSPVNVAPLASGVPSVLTLLEAEPFMWPGSLPMHLAIYWRLFRRLSAKKARIILTISESAKRELVRYMGVPTPKTFVTPLGVDHERFHASQQTSPGIWHTAGDSGYVLWIGRSYPRKNLPRIIEAFGIVKREGFRQKLVIAGIKGWEDEHVLKTISTCGLEEEVILLGRVDDGQLPLLYASADLFLFPSLHEAFGLPIVEAMACGAPVLTSRRGAMSEIAGDAAILVDPEDPEDIAKGIESVLGNREHRQALVQKGIDRARQFDWSKTAAITIAAYELARG